MPRPKFEVYKEEGSVWQRIMRAFHENKGLLLSPGEVLMLSQVEDIQWAANLQDQVEAEMTKRAATNSP